MGKSFIKLIIILGCSNFVFAQDSLCVFKTKGTVLLKSINIKETLVKGDFILLKSKLSVLSKSEISLIDAKGSIYFINKEGDYSFNEVFKHEKTKQNSSLTLDYFKYVWSELLYKNSNKTVIAGVFRGNLLMKFPKDSSKISNSKITLKWSLVEKEKLYYIFVKNVATNEILKIETNGSQLALFNDNPIFAEGDSFAWTVSTNAFPNLKNVPFYHFKIISRKTYKEIKLAFTGFINDLKQIGTSDAEIETILCQKFSLCK